MKIVSWNCNGAFRKKYQEIDKQNADVIIIQECEDPIESKHKDFIQWAENYLWIGDSKNKGIGVFAKNGVKLEKLNWSNLYEDHEVKYFLPFRIDDKYNIIAAWAHQNNSPNFGYIGQIWKYIQINKIKIANSIIIGDFNSNKIWDEWDRWWNHSDVVNTLSEMGLESVYHKYFNENQGEESKATFFLQRKLDKPYHIDYCFSPISLFENLIKFEVGDFRKWQLFSDHNPLFLEYDL